MRTLLATLIVLSLLAGVRADDEKFVSENKAKSVRPSTRAAAKTAVKEKEAEPKKVAGEPLSADKVEEIAALKGKEAAVRGKVHQVFVPNSGAFAILNFGPDYKTCFQVKIDSRNFEKFEGIDSIKKNFAGKEVTVEGTVTLYRKLPQIVVTVPSQIKMAK
jgi:hypothetical protein